MRLGGISTSIKTLLLKTYQDIKVLKSFNKNYIKLIPYKIFSKLDQLIIIYYLHYLLVVMIHQLMEGVQRFLLALI